MEQQLEYLNSKDILQLLKICKATLDFRLLKGTIPTADNESIRSKNGGRLWEKEKFIKWMKNK